MENRRTNNNNRPVQRSNNVVPVRKNGNSVPAARPAQNTSIGMRNQTSGQMKPVNKNAARNGNSVVGMGRRKASSMKAVRSPKIITIRKKERSPFPIAIIFTSIIITALFIFMMMNYAELDKSNNANAQLEAKLTDLEKDQRDLSVKLDKKDNPIYIENYAREKLGMVKKESLPYETINIQPTDRAEVIKYDDGKDGGFGFLLAGVGEVINNFVK